MIHTLEADSIQLAFGEKIILSDIYLKVTTGKIVGLLGRNGEGKSCLMKVIYGSLECEKSIRIDKNPYNKAYRQTGIMACLPQCSFIPRSLSLKRIFKDFETDFDLFVQRFPGFAAAYQSAAGRLSGGELRLVELYIIVKQPVLFVLLDEPFTHLNPVQIEMVKAIVSEEKLIKGLIITDHLYRHVTGICDSLYVLTKGKAHLTEGIADIERLGYARL